MNKLIAPAKKALGERFGYKNVSVRNGQGTAWGWVEVRITTKKPDFAIVDDSGFYSSKGRESMQQISNEAKKIMYEAWKKLGLEPYTYSSDDGYGTESDEVLVSVEYI